MSLFCVGPDFPVEITRAPIPLTHSVSLLLHRLSPNKKRACPDSRHANNIYGPASLWRHLNNILTRYIFSFPDGEETADALEMQRVIGG